MADVEVLFFDVLGTVVDWRGSIAAEARVFLAHIGELHVEPDALADAWVGRYDASVDPIRRGERDFAPLDILNMENLCAALRGFGIDAETLPRAELQALNFAWHRLKPWPDAVEGLTRLKRGRIVAPLSDGSTRLLADMARHGGLPWDVILGADMFRAYKPMPQVYLRACELMDVAPDRAMLVAAHDDDLAAAQKCGLRTAYVARESARDPSRDASGVLPGRWDHAAGDLIGLAAMLG